MKKHRTNHRVLKRQKRKLRQKFFLCLLLGSILMALLSFKITITSPAGEVETIEYNSVYEERGAQATVSVLFGLLKFEMPVTVEGEVHADSLGEYPITYTVKYLWKTKTYIKTVQVVDRTPPVLMLVQDPNHFTLPGHPYEEEGYTAIDAYDGDVSDRVDRKEQDGVVLYTVTDSSGNTACLDRTIVYDDRTPPVVTLDGGNELTLRVGDPYWESYSAEDDLDGDVTQKVTVEGIVDTSKVQECYLTYCVTDAHGNTASAQRVVHVIDARTDDRESRGKVIYLTFDDGPGPYTEELLKILRKYNVKVSFFVTGNEKYRALLCKEVEDGHTVAVHTYCHDYASIYASTDAFWTDQQKMKDVLVQETGISNDLFRFPGGSSNTVSRNFSKNIMSRLASQAASKGLVYFDWNVSSGDAGETNSAQGVFDNITREVQKHEISVVLCHDVKSYTVDAIEDVLKWGIENGYTFLPLSKDSYTAHHPINN